MSGILVDDLVVPELVSCSKSNQLTVRWGLYVFCQVGGALLAPLCSDLGLLLTLRGFGAPTW